MKEALEIAGALLLYTGVVSYLSIRFGRTLEAKAQAELNALRNRVGGAIAGTGRKV